MLENVDNAPPILFTAELAVVVVDENNNIVTL